MSSADSQERWNSNRQRSSHTLAENGKQAWTIPNIQTKIGLSQRISFALLGWGVHGINDLSITVSVYIIQLRVLFRLIYGLNVVTLDKNISADLQAWYKTHVRVIQWLLKQYTSWQMHTLLRHIHYKVLGLFSCITRLDDETSLR